MEGKTGEAKQEGNLALSLHQFLNQLGPIHGNIYVLTNITPRRPIADSMENTIQATSIIDCLFKPHYIFSFPTPGIVIIQGVLFGLSSFVVGRGRENQDEGKGWMWKQVWFLK